MPDSYSAKLPLLPKEFEEQKLMLPLVFSSRPMSVVIVVAGLLALSPTVSRGSSVVFYDTRSSFDTAAPGLPVEGFTHANIPSGSTFLQPSPLDSATNNSVFSKGSILPGLTISNSSPANTPGLIVYGNGAVFGETKSVGTNWFGDSLVLTFASGVSAIGTNVFAATSPGRSLAGDFTADVYHGSTLLDSTTFTEAQGAFGFMGATSTIPITGVTLLYTTDDATTFIDNVAFASQPVVTPTPEPSTFAMAALFAALFASMAALRRLPRRS